jgi:hypothetical protein
LKKERENKIKIAKIKAINPPSLLGIERSTAYRCKKYHSGWIWMGDLVKSDFEKFTGSADQSGYLSIIIHNPQSSPMLTISFLMKSTENLTFKISEFLTPPGLELPVEWRTSIWIAASIKTKKGNKKCIA